MSPGQIEGQWWLPQSPARRRFGRLVLDDDDSWQLVVEGGLYGHQEVGGGQAPGPDDDWPQLADVLYGRANDGSAVSLFDCWSPTLPWPDELNRETWHFRSMAQGHELVAPRSALSDVRVRFGPLLEWAGGHRPQVEFTDERITVTSSSVELGSVETAEGRIRLRLGQDWRVGAQRAEVVPRATFYLEPSAEVTFDDVMKAFVHPLREMLSFLTLAFVDVEELTAKPIGDDGVASRVSATFRTQLQRPSRPPPARLHHQMLAPLSSLPIGLGDTIARWIELRAQYRKVVSFLLLPHSAPYLYADDKFMTAFLAVDDYHARAIGGTAADPAFHKQRVDAIVAAAPIEHRAWTEEMLREKNTKGQTRKLREVIERAGTTGARIMHVAPGFINLAVSCRSKVSHPSPPEEQSGQRYLAVSYGLRWLLRHCLLVDLGMTDEDVGRLVEKRQSFTDDLELISRWTGP